LPVTASAARSNPTQASVEYGAKSHPVPAPRGIDVRKYKSPEAAVRAYWTPEKMAEAVHNTQIADSKAAVPHRAKPEGGAAVPTSARVSPSPAATVPKPTRASVHMRADVNGGIVLPSVTQLQRTGLLEYTDSTGTPRACTGTSATLGTTTIGAVETA